MLSFFPRGVLDEILNLIESVSEEFSSYSYYTFTPTAAPVLSIIYIIKIVLGCFDVVWGVLGSFDNL